MIYFLDWIQAWSRANLDLVFFVYGLAFIVMGVAITVQPRKNSGFKLADILWLLASFALTHGINEFLDMWAMIKGKSPALDTARLFILVISYFFLFEFGRRLLRLSAQKYYWLKIISKLLSPWITLGIMFFILVPAAFGGNKDFIWARYLLGFPGGLFVALGLSLYYRDTVLILEPLKVKKYFLMASLSFFAYALLGGLIVPKGNFFPANWLNTDSFLALAHIPVQVFRAVCALISTAGICGILGIFNWEKTRKTEVNYEIQKAVSSILSLSLTNVPLTELLDKALGIILSIPNLSFEFKGSIFLVEDGSPDVLVLKAQKNFSEAHGKSCARVPFGKCVCGRAASSKRVQFVDRVGKDHEILYEDLNSHGHYCVPILYGENLLGVLNMYVEEGHRHNQNEEDLLITFASVLANIIIRKQSEEKLVSSYDKLKTLQAQLIQASKMSGVGSLAGGIAHEINNPLTGVLNNVQLIKMSAAEHKGLNPADFKELLDSIEDSAQRCAKITSALLDFGRPSKGVFQPVSIKELIDRVLILISHELNLGNIKIEKDIEPDIPEVRGDPQLLQQAIFDILSNAQWAIRKKSKEGGLITVKVRNEPSRNEVNIYISDTGIGISEENKKKLFEPFYTTKNAGEGTGLGLFVVYNIIQQHKGSITAESRLNEGTTFKISLPVG